MTQLSGNSFVGFDEVGSSKTFQRHNPATNKTLATSFAEATKEDVDKALRLARQAFASYKQPPAAAKADFLNAIAKGLRDEGEAITEIAGQESGLPQGRLSGELERTASQLELFAQVVQAGDWLDARIDEGEPDTRRMLSALGPVVVFGSSNFPLAFSVAGGDTASALAAGCPVVVKGHPSHPGTSEHVARVILNVAKTAGLPEGVFSLLQSSQPDISIALVTHPDTAAVGFTGSGRVGRILYDAAAKRSEPIPVFCEMGSVNPLFIFESALNDDLAQAYAGSLTLGAGQFCTNPGIAVLIDSEAARAFATNLAESAADLTPATMLNRGIFKAYCEGLEHLGDTAGTSLLTPAPEHDSSTNRGAHAVLSVDAATFLERDTLQEEVFGPATLLVFCKTEAERLEVARALKGQLTASLHSSEEELAAQPDLLSVLGDKVGRLIFNGFPTGVAVNDSMQHGGPYPASTDPRFTSVGSAAILRFAKPLCYQDCPDALLPPELQRANPLGIRRLVNGSYEAA